MATVRASENPILRPQDLRPSRDDFEVIGVFNAGVARYRDEVILLLRVAERPVGQPQDVVLSPIYDIETNDIILKPFARDDLRNDFSDPRLIVAWASRPCLPNAGHELAPAQTGEARGSSMGVPPMNPDHRQEARESNMGVPPMNREHGPEARESSMGVSPMNRTHGQDARATRETYLTSISHLRLARSRDGRRFRVEDRPALAPANEYETFGLEDPRITCVEGMGSPMYYITYVGVSPRGVTTCLASTRDFESFERHGVIFHPDNKDVVLFGTPNAKKGVWEPGPARGAGRYYALHRPHSALFLRNDIWLAESPDLFCWGNHRHLLGTRAGLWDETRIGAGAVPFRTDRGWIELYHGADRHNRYCLGALLLEGEQPWKILARSATPVFAPEADYEQSGFFGHVVFSCGLLFEDNVLKVYYGAADTSICYAEIPLADVYKNLGL